MFNYFCIIYVYFCLGLATTFLGPLLFSISFQNKDLHIGILSRILIFQGIGLLASLIFYFMFLSKSSNKIWMSASLFLLSFGIVLMPWCSNFLHFSFSFFIQGFGLGLVKYLFVNLLESEESNSNFRHQLWQDKLGCIFIVIGSLSASLLVLYTSQFDNINTFNQSEIHRIIQSYNFVKYENFSVHTTKSLTPLKIKPIVLESQKIKNIIKRSLKKVLSDYYSENDTSSINNSINQTYDLQLYDNNYTNFNYFKIFKAININSSSQNETVFSKASLLSQNKVIHSLVPYIFNSSKPLLSSTAPQKPLIVNGNDPMIAENSNVASGKNIGISIYVKNPQLPELKDFNIPPIILNLTIYSTLSSMASISLLNKSSNMTPHLKEKNLNINSTFMLKTNAIEGNISSYNFTYVNNIINLNTSKSTNFNLQANNENYKTNNLLIISNPPSITNNRNYTLADSFSAFPVNLNNKMTSSFIKGYTNKEVKSISTHFPSNNSFLKNTFKYLILPTSLSIENLSSQTVKLTFSNSFYFNERKDYSKYSYWIIALIICLSSLTIALQWGLWFNPMNDNLNPQKLLMNQRITSACSYLDSRMENCIHILNCLNIFFRVSIEVITNFFLPILIAIYFENFYYGILGFVIYWVISFCFRLFDSIILSSINSSLYFWIFSIIIPIVMLSILIYITFLKTEESTLYFFLLFLYTISISHVTFKFNLHVQKPNSLSKQISLHLSEILSYIIFPSLIGTLMNSYSYKFFLYLSILLFVAIIILDLLLKKNSKPFKITNMQYEKFLTTSKLKKIKIDSSGIVKGKERRVETERNCLLLDDDYNENEVDEIVEFEKNNLRRNIT